MRYVAVRLNGNGTETVIASDLPLGEVTLTPAPLSNAPAFTWSIEPEYAYLKDSTGRPVLLPWSTAIYAIDDQDIIRGAGILKSLATSGSKLTGSMTGWVGYAEGMPWTNSTLKLYGADPGPLVKRIWDTIQSHPLGNIGLVVPSVTTPVKVGIKDTEKDEPFLLANYATDDLGQVLEELYKVGSIEYRETHSFNSAGVIVHNLQLGHPRLGRRRNDIQFNLGVNAAAIPDVDIDAEDYASEVLVIGAGDGDKTIRAHSYNRTANRLRRVHLIKSKGIGRTPTAQLYADRNAAAMSTDSIGIDQLEVLDHPLAPLFSWENGDEVRLVGDAWWGGQVDMWVRVISTSYSPDKSSNTASLELVKV